MTRGPSAAAKHRLHDLLMQLNDARAALNAAEEGGSQERIGYLRQNLGQVEALIRHHCQREGIDLPHDEPQESKT